jgi:hypothetical protein
MRGVLLEVEVGVGEEAGDSSVVIVVVGELVGTQEGVAGEVRAESRGVAKNEVSVDGKNPRSRGAAISGVLSLQAGRYEGKLASSGGNTSGV